MARTKANKPASQEQVKEVKKEQVKEQEQVKELTTKDLASMIGITPKQLRRHLRKHWYNDSKHTNYLWKSDEEIVKEIVTKLKKA